MTKYHIKADSTKSVRSAEKRACRYSDHVHENAQETSTVTPIRDASTLDDRIQQVETERVKNIVSTTLQCPTESRFTTSGFSFETDYEPGDDLSIEYDYMDMRNFLRAMHNVSPDEIPDDYVKYAEQNWSAPENYNITREWGYYEEVDEMIQPTPEFLKTLQQHYYSFENATDGEGVLEYCRGKGFATAGKTPVEALKAQLKAENHGRPHPQVDKANVVTVEKFDLDDVRVSAEQHYARIEPRKPAAPVAGRKVFAGVVTVNEYGQASLVDGYHRVKFLKESTRKRSGTFLALRYDPEQDSE